MVQRTEWGDLYLNCQGLSMDCEIIKECTYSGSTGMVVIFRRHNRRQRITKQKPFHRPEKDVRIEPTRVIHSQWSHDSGTLEHSLSRQIANIRRKLTQSMLTRWAPSFLRRPVDPLGLRPLQSIGKCFFGKTRIVIEGSTKAPSVSTVELNPFNKLRAVSKRTGLPSSHILKALCTREGKSYYLKVEMGLSSEN